MLGDRTTEPDGLAVTPTAGETGATGQTTSVTGDDLIDVFLSVVAGYSNTGTWLMRDATLAFIRKIKAETTDVNQYPWQPGLQARAPDTILGRPAVTDPNMPAMAVNACSILFGDFAKHYLIRDVQAVRFQRSGDYAFGNDLITFRALLENRRHEGRFERCSGLQERDQLMAIRVGLARPPPGTQLVGGVSGSPPSTRPWGAARERRARSVAAELTREGTRVCFAGSTHVPEDEMCFYTFDALSSRAGAGLTAARACSC